MINPAILLEGNFYPEDIDIKINKFTKRATNKDLDLKIESVWEDTVKTAAQKGQLLFDGVSFRLDNYKVNSGSLSLEVSKFKYKIRSSLNKLAPYLETLGKDYYCMGIAIGGFIKTTDNKYVFGRRSGKTITNNSEDFIGGILEPDTITSSSDLFKYNRQEIFEELGLLSNHILDQRLIALILTPSTNVIMLTFTEICLDSQEVNNLFESTNDKFEMSSLLFIEQNKILDYLKTLGGYKPAVIELVNRNPKSFIN